MTVNFIIWRILKEYKFFFNILKVNSYKRCYQPPCRILVIKFFKIWGWFIRKSIGQLIFFVLLIGFYILSLVVYWVSWILVALYIWIKLVTELSASVYHATLMNFCKNVSKLPFSPELTQKRTQTFWEFEVMPLIWERV